MRFIYALTFSLALLACTRVATPPPAAPTPAVEKSPAQAATKPEAAPAVTPAAPNLAAALVDLVRPLKASGYECRPWTGTGTAFPGVDSYICAGQKVDDVIWCAAPSNDAPRCTTAASWRAPEPSEAKPQQKQSPKK